MFSWSDLRADNVLYNISERVLYLYIFSLYIIKRRKKVNVSERDDIIIMCVCVARKRIKVSLGN